MKRLIFCMSILLLTAQHNYAQSKLGTKSGTIGFEASVPSFEEVKAENQNVSAILNTDTGEFAALALMTGFRFKVALMEEHFNENYVESSMYPKAVFKGKIKEFDPVKIKNGNSEWMLEGSLELHGVSKDLSVPVTINWKDGTVSFLTKFTVRPEDFKIEIPSVVSKKIADEVQVEAEFNMN